MVAGWVLSGAQAEQVGKVLNMIVAFAVVGLFTWLVRRYARHYLILVFCAIFGGLFLFFGSVIDQIEMLGPSGVWAFYVTGDIWTTVMVATFWAFANDLNTGDQAERLYGIVGLGGVVGGFVGGASCRASWSRWDVLPCSLPVSAPRSSSAPWPCGFTSGSAGPTPTFHARRTRRRSWTRTTSSWREHRLSSDPNTCWASPPY
jgi:ATP/ADP translocase